MKLNTNAILSLIGAILVIVGLFVPAVHGLVSNGINSNGHITVFEMGDGFIFLIGGIIALLFSFINNLDRFAWIVGGIILAVGLLDLYNIAQHVNDLQERGPMYKEFVYFQSGMFIILIGASMILISGLFMKKIATIATSNEGN